MGSGTSSQCKVLQCFECQGDTEFYCKTCKLELCLVCKDKHVIDLDTKHHYVVIYREKYKYIQKHQTCLRHPDRTYKKYCSSCKLPLCSVCSKCKNHKRHEILDIRKAYTTNREQHKNIVHRIRSEILYKNHFLLADIKTDLKSSKTEILNLQLKLSTKAQRLKDLILTEMFAVRVTNKNKMIQKLQQRRTITRDLPCLEIFEHTYEKSTNKALEFLYFLKNMNVLKMKETSNFIQHGLISVTKEIMMEDVIRFLCDIQIIERGQRQVREEDQLELMSTPVLQKTVKLGSCGQVTHISRLSSGLFWISSSHIFNTDIILTNIAGDSLHNLTCRSQLGWSTAYGAHTVNNKNELIYRDSTGEICKLSADKRLLSKLIREADTWDVRCVYSSPLNGDLLVGLFNYEKTGKVNRYKYTGQYIKTIDFDNKDQKLYSDPKYITENRNGDVIVSDWIMYSFGAVVVTDRGGGHRFSYTGPPLGSLFSPRGICTDALSRILVCDAYTRTVQMIDKHGLYLSNILTQEQGIYLPKSLSYDNKTHLLWVGEWDNKVCVYRYIKRKEKAVRHEISDQ